MVPIVDKKVRSGNANDSILNEHKGIKPESVTPSLLIPWRFPLPSMVISFFLHTLVVLILTYIPVEGRRTFRIDFEKETITYYEVSPNLPDVSSAVRRMAAEEKLGSNLTETPSESTGDVKAALAPLSSLPPEQIVEVSEAKQIEVLPKLELPNVLLKQPKVTASAGPISVTEKLSRDLGAEMNRTLAQLATRRLDAGVSAPLPSPPLPHIVEGATRAVDVSPYASQKLSLALPEEPPSVSPQVGQLNNRGKELSIPVPLWIQRPVDDLPEGGEVRERPLPNGPDVLVYSTMPSAPEGEITVPKVSVIGTMGSSRQSSSGSAQSVGTAEFGSAKTEIPAISIQNRVPFVKSGTGLAVVQPPKPLMVEKEKKGGEKTMLPPLQDRLPGVARAVKVPWLDEIEKGTSPNSPLVEVERQGRRVYTAAINAPNFTSKRGSWIFRFAELPDSNFVSNPESEEEIGSDVGLAETLTAPSAIVKVDPRYPPEVIRDKVEGMVALYAIIRKDGMVDPDSVRILRELDSRLDLSAKEALLGWRFRPSQKNGKPIDIQAEITIPFYFRKDNLYP